MCISGIKLNAIHVYLFVPSSVFGFKNDTIENESILRGKLFGNNMHYLLLKEVVEQTENKTYK